LSEHDGEKTLDRANSQRLVRNIRSEAEGGDRAMKRNIAFAVLFLIALQGWHGLALGQAQPQEAKPVVLIRGLDGGDYQPYAPSVIERVQQELQARNLYSGAIDGVLSQNTMEAIGQFQRENNLQVCGVPTPQTRRLLMQQASAPSSTSQQQ
jgi:peptidoglycan hydrolase-like protein with peptidoglycan-binding domain